MRRILLTLTALPALVAAVLALAPPAAASGGEDATVRVGTEGTYPPYSYKDGSELTGYDIDVMRAVAEEAGWDVEFVETTWDSIFPALDAGRIDTIANQVTINPDREAAYVFSEPYTYSYGVIVTRADEDAITTLDDLEGKVAGASATSNWAQVARDAGARIESVEQFSQAVELLVQGRVDVLVNDNIAVLDYLETSGTDAIKIAGRAGDDVSEQALVFRQEDADLAEQATAAIRALKEDGTLTRISEDYFGADVSVENDGEVAVADRGGRSGWDVVADTWWPMLQKTLVGTIPLTLISFAIGLALAVLVALARLSPSLWLNAPARAFIWVIRGTPLLVQLVIVFYGLGQLGLKLDPWPAAILAFSLNVAGYGAEIVRSAILSVPRGQSEAAATIGMDYATTLRRIVLPQAARVAVPPLSNTFISLLKDTSLASIVLVTELFRVAQTEAAASGRFLQLFLLAALYYLVVTTVLTHLQSRLEKRLGRYVVA